MSLRQHFALRKVLLLDLRSYLLLHDEPEKKILSREKNKSIVMDVSINRDININVSININEWIKRR